jgi:hypothetical protein
VTNGIEGFQARFGDEAVEDVLTRICEAHWSWDLQLNKQDELFGVTFTDVHAHNVVNHTLSGRILYEGEEFSFIIDNGDWNGTQVIEWGSADEVGVYEPPSKTTFTFVPQKALLRGDEHDFSMFSVYAAWTKEAWFNDMVHSLNYDLHFQPGSKIKTYYAAKAAVRSMVIDTEDRKVALLKEWEGLLAISQAERDRLFDFREVLNEAWTGLPKK